jgi:hypothetical protein
MPVTVPQSSKMAYRIFRRKTRKWIVFTKYVYVLCMGLSWLRVRCIGVSGEYSDLDSTGRHTTKTEGIKEYVAFCVQQKL